VCTQINFYIIYVLTQNPFLKGWRKFWSILTGLRTLLGKISFRGYISNGSSYKHSLHVGVKATPSCSTRAGSRWPSTLRTFDWPRERWWSLPGYRKHPWSKIQWCRFYPSLKLFRMIFNLLLYEKLFRQKMVAIPLRK
jgi:hypothetical protein